MRALPNLRVINLVRDQPQVVALAYIGDVVHRLFGIDRACRVVGRVDQQGFRPFGCRL